ncbi:group 1 truncated hemoglobin [Agromyces sp. H3Y2-19a]|uniref:group I truncated hemoglobin n=1 Tax=Agromyces TaxID=33877 RepID=UPI001E28E331|nr:MULTISPECIES: group 1 truncated hemoglobin [Agromyces]MCD5347259.1 group 1 truncated hemoglobin [Agromyces sp. S2-1-8]MDF0513303.1 group 1 truncated hemoglobin [Agromyces chromiiresistens]
MSSPSLQTEPEALSDYAAVGGAPAISAVVDRFYELVLGDENLVRYFDGVEMVRLKRHQVALVSTVMGGPVVYEGRDLRKAHANMGISAGDFAAVAGHLVTALTDAGVPSEIIDRTVSAVAATQPDIVEVTSTHE